VPEASVAASIAFSVPVTVTVWKGMSEPRRREALASTYPCASVTSAPILRKASR
jgi:hypothetical protein